MSVTVYTREGCIQCDMTKKALDRRGSTYDVIDLDARPELIDDLKARGFMALPVVQHDEDWWGGFNPSKLATIPTATASRPRDDIDASFRRQLALTR